MMKNTRLPTLEEIETLTSFLPRLYAEGFSPVAHWYASEKLKDCSYTLPDPKYNPLVQEFFRRVSDDGWLDYEYNPDQGYQMLQDEKLIKTASLPQIQTMLTFCVRGERFSDGHWEGMIEQGHIRRLLERLHEIKSSLLK